MDSALTIKSFSSIKIVLASIAMIALILIVIYVCYVKYSEYSERLKAESFCSGLEVGKEFMGSMKL